MFSVISRVLKKKRWHESGKLLLGKKKGLKGEIGGDIKVTGKMNMIKMLHMCKNITLRLSLFFCLFLVAGIELKTQARAQGAELNLRPSEAQYFIKLINNNKNKIWKNTHAFKIKNKNNCQTVPTF